MSEVAKRIGDIAAHAAQTGQTPDDISHMVALEVDAAIQAERRACAELARAWRDDSDGASARVVKWTSGKIGDAILARKTD